MELCMVHKPAATLFFRWYDELKGSKKTVYDENMEIKVSSSLRRHITDQNILRERMQALESTGFFGFSRVRDLKIKAHPTSCIRHSCEGRNPPINSQIITFYLGF